MAISSKNQICASFEIIQTLKGIACEFSYQAYIKTSSGTAYLHVLQSLFHEREEFFPKGKCLGTVGIPAFPWAILTVHWPKFPARLESSWFRMYLKRLRELSPASPGDAKVRSGWVRQGVWLDLRAWP